MTVSAKAAAVLKAALADADAGDVVHLTIDGKFEHGLDVGPREATSATVESNGITVQVDAASARRAAGVVIDYIEGPGGQGFKIENPNRPAAVKATGPKELKALLDAGTVKHFYDVRTPKERETASIASARHLDEAASAELEALDKSTPIAFHCHHGGRSQNAAEHFLQQGFKNVYNLAGGIDAWSAQVDPKVPRY